MVLAKQSNYRVDAVQLCEVLDRGMSPSLDDLVALHPLMGVPTLICREVDKRGGFPALTLSAGCDIQQAGRAPAVALPLERIHPLLEPAIDLRIAIQACVRVRGIGEPNLISDIADGLTGRH